MFKKVIVTTLIMGTLLFIGGISIAQAQGNILPKASGPSCGNGQTAQECGNYTINDFVQLAVNVARWIIGIVGSLSLVMFVYGGVMFLISGGSADKVAKAKKIIVAAIIGLAIVFSSYLIIKFVLGAMGVSWNGQILDYKTLGK